MNKSPSHFSEPQRSAVDDIRFCHTCLVPLSYPHWDAAFGSENNPATLDFGFLTIEQGKVCCL